MKRLAETYAPWLAVWMLGLSAGMALLLAILRGTGVLP